MSCTERSTVNLQACLERAPQARQYYSDPFPGYDNLYYGAPYEMRSDKKRDLFRGSCQCGLVALFETAGRQISLFLSSFGRLTQEPTTLCLLLQPTSVVETEISPL